MPESFFFFFICLCVRRGEEQMRAPVVTDLETRDDNSTSNLISHQVFPVI